MRKTILFAGLILLLVLVSGCLPSPVPEEKPAQKPVPPTALPPEEREALTTTPTTVGPERQEPRPVPSAAIPKKEPAGRTTMKFRFANEAKSDATLIAFINGEKMYEKKFTAAVGEGQCIDNLQCESDQHCLDGRCSSLSTLYKKAIGSQGCGKRCHYYALVVSTSDGENYNVKPKRGSYSCAGALEWKIMENVEHCETERPVVPVTIIMKQPGEIISEQVITLKQRESKEVQHPTLPNCKLGLTIEEIYELCEE